MKRMMSPDKLRELMEQVNVGIDKLDTGDLEDENPYALADIYDKIDEVRKNTTKSLKCVAAIQKKIDQA